MTGPPKTPSLAAELSAEFAGTLILILFGVGVVAQVVAGGLGDHDSIAWAWGIGVTLGVYVSARLSGGHINPAVTFALAVFKGFPWRKVPAFWAAQFAGAFIAALLVRWDYSEVLAKFDPGHTFKSQFVFSTLPGNGTLPIGTWGAVRDQVIGTAILLFVVLALTDLRNSPPLANLTPVVIGLLVVAIGMAWGTCAGYAINPARDLGPRLAQYITGYDTAWRDQHGDLYFWVPIAAPLVGGVVGAGLYLLLIGRHIPEPEDFQAAGAERKPEYDVP
ncbi:MIP/aquaporin family protein [Actinomadura roseirufa]|uniref:MIP/aquaporin family protein n=1 Tax=Actinomadura roseirufa TaxID=2094049 RepID=UPI001040ED92|nr:MIP/aquaporin family protein [Actinomadura roseirufa]